MHAQKDGQVCQGTNCIDLGKGSVTIGKVRITVIRSWHDPDKEVKDLILHDPREYRPDATFIE